MWDNFYFRQTAIFFLYFFNFNPFFFTIFLFFPYLFRFNFGRIWTECAHSFLPTYLGGTFSPLLDISERNFFPGGRGVHGAPSAPPPAYAPELLYTLFSSFTWACAVFSIRRLKWLLYTVRVPKNLHTCQRKGRQTPSVMVRNRGSAWKEENLLFL